MAFHPLNAELNPICYLLTLLGDHPIFHISRIRVNGRKLYFLPLLVIAVSLETFGKPSYVCILKFLCRIRNYFYIGSYTIVFSIITITLQSLLIHVLFAGGRNAKTAHKLSCVSLLAALYFYVYLYHSAVIFFFFFVIFTDSICIVNTCHNMPTSTCIHLPCLFVFMTIAALWTLKSTQTEHALIESHASGLVGCPYNCRSSQN